MSVFFLLKSITALRLSIKNFLSQFFVCYFGHLKYLTSARCQASGRKIAFCTRLRQKAGAKYNFAPALFNQVGQGKTKNYDRNMGAKGDSRSCEIEKPKGPKLTFAMITCFAPLKLKWLFCISLHEKLNFTHTKMCVKC